MDTEVQRNARLEPEIKNFRDRENFLSDVNILKKKRLWLVSYMPLVLQIDSQNFRNIEHEACIIFLISFKV